jgi:large subunit ribosomal protein L15
MITLSNLRDLNERKNPKKKVGRGLGSGKGKTCGRGHKGDKSRSGYKRRHYYTGAGAPYHKTFPTRGFSNAAFKTEFVGINLDQLDLVFADGEAVTRETLIGKGLINKNSGAKLKLLGRGELLKKLNGISVDAASASALEKVKTAGITLTVTKTLCTKKI